jgi:predicted NBD/HSP70 family sugar kinase
MLNKMVVSADAAIKVVWKPMYPQQESNEPSSISFVQDPKKVIYVMCLNDLTSKMIYDAAKKGDAIALDAFTITGEILGVKLSDVVAITNPEAIFILGGLAQAGELIFKPTQRFMEKNLFPVFRGKVKILPSKLKGKNAAVLGAAALAWKALNIQ